MGGLTFTEFKAFAESFYGASKDEYRYGQAVFNALSHARPDIAQNLAGTMLDPFFKDEVSEQTWNYIFLRW